MLKVIAALLLVACNDQYSQEDAHAEWVEGICTHGVTCGTSTHPSIEACVDHVMKDSPFCFIYKCGHPYKKMDELRSCLDTYNSSCSNVDDCGSVYESGLKPL